MFCGSYSEYINALCSFKIVYLMTLARYSCFTSAGYSGRNFCIFISKYIFEDIFPSMFNDSIFVVRSVHQKGIRQNDEVDDQKLEQCCKIGFHGEPDNDLICNIATYFYETSHCCNLSIN